MDRRDFLLTSISGISGLASLGFSAEPLFRISLAEWSFHRALFSGAMTHLDFITRARKDYGLDAVEYVKSGQLGKIRLVNLWPARRTLTRGCSIRTGPRPVWRGRSGKRPLRTTKRRPFWLTLP